ncbi:MAG: efflux RND transporter permease subunit [Sphingomonadales bacterium]|uniref:efflux RND transporter permease subunit n=1 Tax=Novosphingobium sp. NDB2Meth1 TaxID=1892847 RepID=UPI0009303146|nr:efflux RND transporter permease subunit [Novosphingobium sp. NDB2Meth1]MBU6393888.1 efflux RND transporter permease subunit [Sphingomonadales bacterium]
MKGPNLSSIAVKEPSVTLFLLLAAMAAGIFAFFQLGRAEDPSFTLKVLTVTAVWPGASAREMQDQVADRLEKRIQELPWSDRIETQARPGLVTLTVVFSDKTPPSEVPEMLYQARKKMSDEAINLPRGVIGPIVNDEYSDVFFSLIAVQAKGLPHRALIERTEAIRSELQQVKGVKKVVLIGEQRPRIYVEISNRKLATLGLGADAVLGALANQNLIQPAAQFETSSRLVPIRVTGAFDDLDAVRATPIAAGGRVLHVGDVAEVKRGYEDPPTYQVRHQGGEAVMLGVVMQDKYNGLALGGELSAKLSDVRARLPLGVTVTEVADQAANISEAYGEFMLKFAVALSVVMVVSLIALGWRVGIVVALSVPLTLAAVFVIMLMTGRQFDRITLGALILSLGLLVDDAIIAIEMMVVKLEEGMSRVESATFAWGATAGPMLAGTIVTIVGFLPVGFARSTAGEYAGNIFWIVGFALLVSWIVAVYFTPYLGVKLLPDIKPVEGGHDAIYATPRYQQLRHWITRSVAQRGRLTIGVVLAMVLAGVLLVVAIPKQFFPISDRPELLIEVYNPHGSSLAATRSVVEKIEHDLLTRPDMKGEARYVNSYLGGGAPRFFLSLNPEPADPSFAKLIVLTHSPASRDRLRLAVQKRAAEGAYQGARVRALSLLFGPPVPYPVAFRVTGPDPDQLRRIAAEVSEVVRANPNTVAVNTDWGDRTPSVTLQFDNDRLRLLGLDPASVSRQVYALISGATVSQARYGDRTTDVVVRTPGAERHALGDLGSLVIGTANGTGVTLSQVAKIVPTSEDPLLMRRNRAPTMTVRADITKGIQPADVTAAIQPKLQPLIDKLPAGYAIVTAGSVEEAGKANAALAPLFPIMIGFMLLVLMLQTRSFRMTGLVFATAPLGLLGAIPALLVTGFAFGFNAILGLIGLAGILMRNTLILVDQIDSERARGLGLEEAVIEATVRRARPVLLTALAAVLAFLPLTLSSFWGPLAVVLIGGTLVGTALTLFFLPALYALWMVRR